MIVELCPTFRISNFQKEHFTFYEKKKKFFFQKEHFTPPDYFRPRHATDSKFFFFFSIPLSKEVVLHLPTTTGLSMPLIINVFFFPNIPLTSSQVSESDMKLKLFLNVPFKATI